MLPRKAEGGTGKRIGRFLVVARIGRGGMGMVYRALDEALEREVAVKTLTAEGSLDAESRRRFQVEAKAAAKLQHPNIVTVYELGEDRGVAFIAMELLPGADLEAVMRSGEPMLPAEKLDVVIQIARGLAFAHEHGIVHRDIKPSNIRLLDDGMAKIMDFGIAKLGGTTLTKTGMMVGTVHYMSPEQVRGQRLDGRSDVFSVGVILYELLAGQRPFKGEGPTEVLYKIVNEEAPPLDVTGVEPRLREIVARALAKDPAQRYASAKALADDLAEVLQSLPKAAAGSAVAEAVAAARRALKEGRGEEGLQGLKKLAQEASDSVDVRRALRTVRREVERLKKKEEARGDDFPELEATLQAPPTLRPSEPSAPSTVVLGAESTAAGTVVVAGATPRAGHTWLAVAVLGLLAAVGAAVLLLTRAPAPPVEARIPVRSQPTGAGVFLDGKDTGVRTNGELVVPGPLPAELVLTFRMPGHKDETRNVQLPLAAGEAVSVALPVASSSLAVSSDPPGAAVSLDGQKIKGATPLEVSFDPSAEHRLAVSLDGYAPQEVRLAPGQAPPELRVKLEPSGPLGSVRVAAIYPVDVIWRGKVLAKDQVAPVVSLPGGRQVLTIVSPAHFLKTDVPVNVTGGTEATLEMPSLGKVSIRANPDNCQVFIDGTFVDYPPILDKPVAAGAHTVSFRWPDGAKTEEKIEVATGKVAYVTGRKD